MSLIQYNNDQKKISTIVKIILIAFFIICIRLIYLQIISGENLLTMSKKNFLRIEKTFSYRGNILDCNGNHLVTTTPYSVLEWHGTGNKRLSEEQKKLLEDLSPILEEDLTSPEILNQIRHTEIFHKHFQLSKELTLEKLSKIQEKFPLNANLHISTKFKRLYPYKKLASHIVGYLGQLETEPSGKMGLEKILDNTLKSEVGETLKIVNSFGRQLESKEIKQALAGQDIKTTLDLNLQQLVELNFPEEVSGTIIMMDPENGAIKALVSRPNFDPTIFLSPISQEDWSELQEDNTFLNRAFYACYPPASIFKLVTLSAALETRITHKKEIFTCNGFYLYGNRKYLCANKSGHGHIKLKHAIAHSCNIPFLNIGSKISIDTIFDYAQRYGLNQKTNSIMAEQTGLIPNKMWKKTTKGEKWWQGETLSACIGQSFNSVTPIQIARMFSSIFTKKLIKPRILLDETIESSPLNIKQETLDFLKKSIRSTIKIGSGKKLNNIKDMIIYAKTGTAQTMALQKRNLSDDNLEHAWFVSHFQYKNKQPLVMVVLLERVGSSRVAVTITKNILLSYKNLMKNNTDQLLEEFNE
ncbi:MAG: Penicillin-binding protein 2 [candidate division TM6 bacterium GW2011_GWF2_32_72]|nr:MAG: Penicillin-binding protein 2 [candidate division TM6 bacterium GW2011_GWF2_32_72]